MKDANKIKWILLLTSLMLVFGACGKNSDESKNKNSSDSNAEVIVSKVQKGPIFKAYNAMGTVVAYDIARIIPKVPGRIIKVYVTEGSEVRAGQVLMQLSDAEYDFAVKGFSAVAKMAEVGVDKSRRDLERAESLHREQAIPEQMYQDAKSQLEANKYQMDQALSQVNNARKAVNECRVISPISGIVTSKFVNEGEIAAPQAPMPAFIVENMNMVKMEIDLSEDAFGYLAAGNRCIVTVDAIPDKAFEGTISKISPSINAISKTFKVTISIDNPDTKLRSGMTARAQVVQKARNDAIYVSKSAFMQGEEGFYVYKLSGGKVQKTTVKRGIEGSDNYEVTDGLQPGDFVVVQGQVGLSNGMKVNAKERIIRETLSEAPLPNMEKVDKEVSNNQDKTASSIAGK